MINRIFSPNITHLKQALTISFVLVLITLLLQGCGDKKLLSRVSESGTILAFGDSLTSGVGVNPEYSYPSTLAKLSGKTVVNAGISGEITKQGLARLAKVIQDTDPELLILLEGGNDILRNQNLIETKSNLSAMIDLAKEQGVQVVLIGVPQKQFFSDTADLYIELAEEHKVLLESTLISTLIRNRKYKSDSVHFNKRGYHKMAEEIHDLLKDNGAL